MPPPLKMATNPLQPTPALLAKIGSLIVHAEEMISEDGHAVDRAALASGLLDTEVQDWLRAMGEMAMVPVKRVAA